MSKAVGAVVGATVGFFVGGPVGAVVGAGLGYAGSAVVEQMLNPGFDVPDIAALESQSVAGILLNKEGTDNYIPVVYGQRYIGGTRVHMTTDSANNQYLYVKTVLCEGKISRVNALYLDDSLAWMPGAGFQDKWKSYTAKNKDNADITIYPVDFTYLQEGSPGYRIAAGYMGPGWTVNHHLQGLAYFACKYQNFPGNNQDDANKNPFTNGIPNLVAFIDGKKVIDISQLRFYTNESRTTIDTTGAYYQSTNGRSGYRPDDLEFRESIPASNPTGLQITGIFSRNPVNCLFDYLTNPIYGKGLKYHQIDLWSFKQEALRWYKKSDGTTLAADLQHHCDAVIDTGRTVFENVENMLFNMNATLPFINGRFTLKVESNGVEGGRYGGAATSVMTVDENNIIGGVSIESESIQSKYNRVVVSYPGGEFNEMKEVYYPAPGSTLEAQYLAEDNGRINELRLSFEHITSYTIALYQAQFALEKSRYRGKVINFVGDSSLNQITIGDIFTFSYSNLGINAQFRVKQIQFNPDYTFNVVAEEHNDTIYGVPVAAAVPKDIYKTFSTNAQPIYIKNSEPKVVYVGDYNESVESQPIATMLAELPSDWETYVTDNFNLNTVSYTKEEIEAGLEDGTITRWINADILVPGTALVIPPEIVSSEYIINADSTPGNADIIINLKKNNNANIINTKLLIYDYQQRLYKNVFIPESTTAASRGQITLKNYPLGIPIKYIVQYVSASDAINSPVGTINLTPYYETNKIQAEFLDTPKYSLDNGIQWDDPAADSSTLQWSETGTWTTGTTDETHTPVIYTTAAIDLGQRIDAYPDTTVLYRDLSGATPGNLKITYLVSEDNTTYYEIPYDLMPCDLWESFSYIDPAGTGAGSLVAGYSSASFSGPPRYYKTKITLNEGEFYGVITRWKTDVKTKTLNNYNMYSVLYIEDEATYPNCDFARLQSRPTGSTKSDYATAYPDAAQDWVAVGGTPDLSLQSVFTGNLVGSIIPTNGLNFGKITSAVGETAFQGYGDTTPPVVIRVEKSAINYTEDAAQLDYQNLPPDGNFYFGLNGSDAPQTRYLWSMPYAIHQETGNQIRLYITDTDQEIDFVDMSSGTSTPIFTGPLKMNWTFTGYPQLAFDEEQGTVKPVEEI